MNLCLTEILKKSKMRTIQLIALFVLCATGVQAQDTFYQNMPLDIEREADSLTIIYSKKLGMTAKQDLLFKKKLAAFLMQKERVKEEYSGKRKLDALYTLGGEENAEMSDILTEEQFDLYKRLKATMQPLAVVNKE